MQVWAARQRRALSQETARRFEQLEDELWDLLQQAAVQVRPARQRGALPEEAQDRAREEGPDGA
jgi:hypothetical protein